MVGRGDRRVRRRREAEEEMWAVAVAGHVPADLGRRLRHLDYEFTCVDCGRREIRTAEGPGRSTGGQAVARPVRCRACRGARRGGD